MVTKSEIYKLVNLNNITFKMNNILPWPKKRTIVMMHHVVLKNLRSDFAAMHPCVKSRQSQVREPRSFAVLQMNRAP